MQGSEPFLSDTGLTPVAMSEKDGSLHLYRRNSCHQERLHQDLQRLRYQQDRALRRANREIIDLNIEQKKRRETLNRPRRRSECLGVQRPPDSDDVHTHVNQHPLRSFHTSSQSSVHRTANRSPSTSSTAGSFPRRRASISTPTSLPPLPRATTTTDASSTSPIERPKSRSFEQLHSSSSNSIATKSSMQEMYMDSKSRKDFTRLKKVSDRWRDAAQKATNTERTGKPLIPTSSFAGSSTGKDHDVHKTSQVFERLSVNTKTSTMSSENFIKALKIKYKARDGPSNT